ncbi:MAG: hypothetical protein ACP5D7_08645 [Limnospira sp.]
MNKIDIKHIKEWVKIALVNLVMLAVFLELGSLAFYFIRNNQFFYTRERPQTSQDLGLNLEGMRMELSVVERLHPFFGYVQKPGPDFRPGFMYNNYGFISPYDYPFVKTNENQYIVGVFGGSVASNYSIFEIQNKILETKLKQIPELKDKEIIILSFATGGYKQPQQLLILNYMLSVGQVFDMVVNIDGFNEIALSNVNNDRKLDLMMPSAAHIEPLTSLANNNLSTKALETLLKIKETKPRINDAIATLKDCNLASCHTLNSLHVRRLIQDYRRDVKRFQRYQQNPDEEGEGSVFLFYQQESPLPEPEALQKIINNWVKTSTLMSQILSAQNIPYFHVIQPNQYYPTDRVYSEEEREVAFSDDSPYGDAIEVGYPLLLNRIPELQAAGVTVFNGVKALDNTPEIMYIDDCCHYTPAGERLLSSYIAESIVNTLNPQKKQPPQPKSGS